MNLAVLLPLYAKNNPEHLRECLESLAQQSFKDFDLFICEDGPLTTALLKVISTFEYELNIISIQNKCRLGLAGNLNSGLKEILSRGYKFIARMDGDDICFPTRFEKQLEVLNQNKEFDLVGIGRINYINNKGINRNQQRNLPLTHIECKEYLKRRNPFCHPSVLFRSTFFKKAGLYPTEPIEKILNDTSVRTRILSILFNTNHINYGGREDYLLWALGFLNDCRVCNIEECLIHYRVSNYKNKHGKINLRKARQILFDKLVIFKYLDFGFDGYINAFLKFGFDLLPETLKSFLFSRDGILKKDSND